MVARGEALQQGFINRGTRSSAGFGGATAVARAKEDRPYDLIDMAQRDLNAALQLLAQRAEYITQAGGAAIALRRDGRNEMMCRARAGVNAPEVGALFSTEFGLSGESVRTARPLRCNDAAHDGRVNRGVCRELGIASVMVMPIVNDDHVMGVFELFSGKTNAFGERDQAALQRLSEMVGIAIRLANAAGASPQMLKSELPPAPVTVAAAVAAAAIEARPAPQAATPPAAPPIPMAAPPTAIKEQKKKLWSALDVGGDAQPAAEHDQGRIPPVLRSLRKCDVCGFPVSPGRSLCVECEEKNWRGRLTVVTTGSRPVQPSASDLSLSGAGVAPRLQSSPSISADIPAAQELAQLSSESFSLSAGIEPSQSWLGTHKYIIGAVLAAATVIAVLLLR